MTRRYPTAPLAALMGLAEGTALDRLGVSGTTAKEYRTRGVTERVADRLATRAGYHPGEIWPEWTAHAIEDAQRPCEECAEPFIPSSDRHRFCAPRCANRHNKRRRYQTDPATRTRTLERKRRWNENCVDYKNAAERRRYWADPGRQRERKRQERQAARRTTPQDTHDQGVA